MNRVTAILPAAGLGTRMGADTPKQFLSLDGVPVLLFTLRRLAACPAITDFVIATRAEEIDSVAASVASENLGRPVRVVRGGDTRQDSVANALAEVPSEADLILVHDAVRPLVTLSQIERVIAEADACDAAILGIPAMDTVKEVKRASLPNRRRAHHGHDSARTRGPGADSASVPRLLASRSVRARAPGRSDGFG